MVYRYSWLAGIAAIAFAFWRLDRLLVRSGDGLPWQVVVGTALVVGAVVTWAAVSYRLKAGWIVLINLVLFLVAVTRFAAPDTGFWIFPDADSVATVSAEVQRAGSLIRYGIEPVDPILGLVAMLAALFWGLGALLVYGLMRGRPYLGLLPPLVVGLQLLTIERSPSSNLDIAVYVLLVALTALAVGVDEHDRGAGRMSAPGRHPRRASGPLSRTALTLVAGTVLASLVVSAAMAARIPTDGILTWRAPGSLTAGLYGSISYDPFVEIHRGLVSQSRTPLFSAAVAGDVDPRDVYYRLVTLDTYSEDKWSAIEGDLVDASPATFAAADQPYAGPVAPVTASIRIHRLAQDYLPAPYAAIGVEGADEDSFRVRSTDVSIQFANNRTYPDMEYTVTANVPLMDSGAVAFDEEGRLSPLFEVARQDEHAIPDPETATTPRALVDAERYLQLPDTLDPEIADLARTLTERLTTDFEKGLLLERWFRESGGFVYTLDVDPTRGHGPDALASWLLDDSETNVANYRRGYCEQFATSMGVMARTLGIPARVVLGFLPGEPLDEGGVLVRDTSAHSWVELWIPSQGWMRFDPTPRADLGAATYQRLNDQLRFDIAEYLDSLPELPEQDRSEFDLLDTALQPEPALPDLAVGVPGSGGAGALSALGIAFTVFLVLAVLFLGAIPGAKWLRRRARLRRLAAGDVGAAWDVIVATLADLDRPVDPSSTPHETAAQVGSALQPLASVYTSALYGPDRPASAAELDTATRSMTVAEERLLLDATPSGRLRARYRLRSILGGWSLSRWLPWLRR